MCIELDLKNIFFVIDGSDNVFARMVASALFGFYKRDGAAVVYSSTETGVCCNIHDIVLFLPLSSPPRSLSALLDPPMLRSHDTFSMANLIWRSLSSLLFKFQFCVRLNKR